jgi:hypothetical protein
MVPGVMVSIMFSLSIGVTGLMFVTEKKDGLLDRSWVAGMTTVEGGWHLFFNKIPKFIFLTFNEFFFFFLSYDCSYFGKVICFDISDFRSFDNGFICL